MPATVGRVSPKVGRRSRRSAPGRPAPAPVPSARSVAPATPPWPGPAVLGAAHPLLRVALAGDRPTVVVAASGGLGEAVRVTPDDGAAELAAGVQAQVDGGRDVDSVPGEPAQAGFAPYASAPRAWRERGQDLRLEGVVQDGRVRFPPPAGVEGPARGLARRGARAHVDTDHVYPGADTVDMAVVTLDEETASTRRSLPATRSRSTTR